MLKKKKKFTLSGTQVMSEEWTVGSVRHLMIYVYDAEGSPVGFRYRNSTYNEGEFKNYIYGKNVQGDIIYIFNTNGDKVAEFGYDAWGNPVSTNYYNSSSNPGVTYSPFRYRGYWYDEETGLYYLNSRYYNPEWGRFLNADIYLNTNGDIIGFNLFAYCGNEPVDNIDDCGLRKKRQKSIWSLKSDAKGRAILWHYLYGKGDDFIKEDGSWGKYMKKNDYLKQQIQNIVFPIGGELGVGEEKEVSIVVPMVIENGEDIIGYQYLHGTNADAGGFTITGTISKSNNGDVTYDLTYTWNDIIDPNYKYDSDSKKAEFAKKIPFAKPTDYKISISWSDKSVIKANPTFWNRNKGWLK